MAKYAMVIDLHKCVGCSGCAIACKIENNVDTEMFWAHHEHKTTGEFPNVTYEYYPTLCNHCTKAACVENCPTKAMYKDENGLTLHNAELCIGCRTCMESCPYGVIAYNEDSPHSYWSDPEALIEDCTASGSELQEILGSEIPYYNKDREATYPGIRKENTVEKCTMCDHRLKDGLLPYCAESCPAQARIFGDLDDPNSEISKLLEQYDYNVLKPEEATEPKVYYIRSY